MCMDGVVGDVCDVCDVCLMLESIGVFPQLQSDRFLDGSHKIFGNL